MAETGTTVARSLPPAPLTAGQIIDAAIRTCLAHWRTLLVAAVIVALPAQLATTLLTADYTVSTAGSEDAAEPLERHLGALAAAGVVQALAVLLATAACMRTVAGAYLLGEGGGWRASLGFALRRAGALAGLALLLLAGIGAGLLAFVVPGVWLAVAWAFALPVLLLEGRAAVDALRRSLALVRGRWWRTFGVLLAGFALALAVSSTVQFVFVLGIAGDTDNEPLVLALNALAGVVGLTITTPFQAALVTILYLDSRVRAGEPIALAALDGLELAGAGPGLAGSPASGCGRLRRDRARAGAARRSAEPEPAADGEPERLWPSPPPSFRPAPGAGGDDGGGEPPPR